MYFKISSLKHFLLLLAIAHYANCNIQQQCLTDTAAEVQILRKEFGDYETDSTVDDHVVRKFFLCLFQKNGVMKSDGSVDVPNFREYIKLLVSKYGNLPTRLQDYVKSMLNDINDGLFKDTIEKNTIKLVNGVKLVFMGIHYGEGGGNNDLFDVIME